LSAELKKENWSLVGQKKAKDLEIETLKATVSMANKKVSLVDSLEEEVRAAGGNLRMIRPSGRW